MENKINVAELLKDCPKGMELDCILFDDVYFDCIDDVSGIIKCYLQDLKHSISISFNKYGGYSNISKSKCAIFPKGKTTWEGFVPPCKFKVGDKVTHNMGTLMNVVHMYWDDECNVIRYDIQSPVDNNYKLKAMLAEHLQPYKEENMKEELEQITLDIPKGYEFFGINDDNQVVLAKKQLQYPTTYEECCEVIGYKSDRQSVTGYLADLIEKFQQLIICRNAYWKIAGDWKFDFDKECFYLCNEYGSVQKFKGIIDCNAILTFPTEEMRDAFYENFKELINETKELL